MTPSDLHALLNLLTPDIVEVNGRLLLQSEVECAEIPCPQSAENQRDCNRMFVVTLLDELVEPPLDTLRPSEETQALITGMAELWAAALQAHLSKSFPGRQVIVEIIGADGVEDEPLEVAVTFYETN